MARNKLQVINKSRSEKYNEDIPTPPVEKETKKKKLKKIKKDKKHKEEKETKEFNPFLKKVLIYIILLITAFITYSMFIETNMFIVKEYKIESKKIPDSFNGIKVIQISDINYGTSFTLKDLKTITDQINELNPDIVLFTGNLINKNIKLDEKTQKNIIKQLNKIEASISKYAIYGSNDYNSTFNTIMNESNFHILDNSSELIYYKSEIPIVITGFNTNKADINYAILTNPIDEIDTTNYYKIVLSHNPNIIDDIKTQQPDLMLSGNTLGGLINIGTKKPLFLNEDLKYYKKKFKINQTQVFISNGLGTNELNMRFNNPPSINFFRIYKK